MNNYNKDCPYCNIAIKLGKSKKKNDELFYWHLRDHKDEVDKEPSKADNFFESIKNDPQAILEWCDSEIREYQKLKDLILKSTKNGKRQTK